MAAHLAACLAACMRALPPWLVMLLAPWLPPWLPLRLPPPARDPLPRVTWREWVHRLKAVARSHAVHVACAGHAPDALLRAMARKGASTRYAAFHTRRALRSMRLQKAGLLVTWTNDDRDGFVSLARHAALAACPAVSVVLRGGARAHAAVARAPSPFLPPPLNTGAAFPAAGEYVGVDWLGSAFVISG